MSKAVSYVDWVATSNDAAMCYITVGHRIVRKVYGFINAGSTYGNDL